MSGRRKHEGELKEILSEDWLNGGFLRNRILLKNVDGEVGDEVQGNFYAPVPPEYVGRMVELVEEGCYEEGSSISQVLSLCRGSIGDSIPNCVGASRIYP